MSKAYVTVGIPGSGKTHWAATLGCPVVNRDDTRLEITGDPRDHSREAEVTARCHARIREAAQAGVDVAISDTNLHPGFRAELVALLRELGFEVELVAFLTSPEVSRARNLKRENPVPEQAMDRMQAAMEEFMKTPESAIARVELGV